MEDILIPLSFFGALAAIILVPQWLKSRERREMQATLRASVEKGQPLPADVIEALSRENIKPKPTASRDLRWGVILLAGALGVGATFWTLGYYMDPDAYPFGAWAAIPGFIGVAFIILSFFNKNRD